MHSIDIQTAVQMIDFMLQDPGIPAGSVDGARAPLFIQALDMNAMITGHESSEPRQAETTFKELDIGITHRCQNRIDDDVKRNRLTFTFGSLLLRQIAPVLRQVFNDRQLDRLADLRRRKSDPGRLTQRLVHHPNKLTQARGLNLLDGEFTGLLTQYRFSGLKELEEQAVTSFAIVWE